MTDLTMHRFTTALGTMAIVVLAARVCGVTLPADSAELDRWKSRRWPQAHEQEPDRFAGSVIAAIRALFLGQSDQLAAIAVDLAGVPAFNRQVYNEAVRIPAGETRTYGEVARALGDVGLARAVGRALGENPVPVLVPCHRVLAADGRTGGFSAPGGVATKLRLLNIERVFSPQGGDLFGSQPLPLAVRPPV